MCMGSDLTALHWARALVVQARTWEIIIFNNSVAPSALGRLCER